MFKSYYILFFIGFILLFSCNSTKNSSKTADKPYLESETIRIANDEIEYEVIIIDAGFQSWFNSYAKPRNFYSQNFMESRNNVWVLEWNRRARLHMQYNPNLYEMEINYNASTNYGYEVNYMIYNYLVYFQLTNNQTLGGFTPRI